MTILKIYISTIRNSKVKLKKIFKIARRNIKMKLINYLRQVLILMIFKIIFPVF
ncbi:shiE [Escherichia coli]|nr:shiE [Escherichia coli]OYJ42741.1 shiE [Shigella boydii]OYL32615.1 shiE [Shigella sonnei]EEV5609932.1 shiE [Escherichia coli]EEV7812787.1 shiE [Escherichia coli]